MWKLVGDGLDDELPHAAAVINAQPTSGGINLVIAFTIFDEGRL